MSWPLFRTSHGSTEEGSWAPVISSNMAAGQKVEGAILAAIGSLKFVPQPELPLVLQLQSDDGLTEGASVLADHTERGTCGRHHQVIQGNTWIT